ncbi:MAG: indole-3-glycerol phosphate synthase TrpC [Desulfobacterales bacterium]|nr:indole-3-glycerol phosphate synthase TrpC [Desulfobacterales bacterium]
MKIQGFLEAVLAAKTDEIARARQSISEATLRSDAEQTQARASIMEALAQSSHDDPGIIAEIKKASPSQGDIRPNLDVKTQADAYTKGGARAISVLTEPRYFKGSIQDLEAAREVSPLPLLRKDFIVSSYQIFEAKRAGASSVLLITTLLSLNQQKDYTALVRELGMEPLVEINSEWEFEQAYQSDGRLVGINNRNLTTLKVDPDAARRVTAIIPEDVLPVAASGIHGREQIEQLSDTRLCNFLIGESIVRSPDPKAFIRELRGKQDDSPEE